MRILSAQFFIAQINDSRIGASVCAGVFGNIALIVFGFTLPYTRLFRWYSAVSGTVGLVALVLFLSHHRFFLELGGMERVVAYPLLLGLIVAGGYFATKRVRVAA